MNPEIEITGIKLFCPFCSNEIKSKVCENCHNEISMESFDVSIDVNPSEILDC